MTLSPLTSRQRVLRLLAGDAVDRVPCFSGMGNVTTAGLRNLGYSFAAIHLDAGMMAGAAATSYKLLGIECGVVPFDLCIEAEALGCEINTYARSEELLYPTIARKLIPSEAEMGVALPSDIAGRGRVPLVAEAIGLLKGELGDAAPVGSYVLGPFTLAGQVMELNELLKLALKKPDKVAVLLERMSDAIAQVAGRYESAGADYLTIREMGATSDVLGPRVFRSLVLPHLKRVFARLSVPGVLHICGRTDDIVPFMMESGAAAISVDQKNDLAGTRAKVGPRALVFGNVDPYNVLVAGTPELVRAKVRACLDAGVSAVWPGCDIWPLAPPQNIKAMLDEITGSGR